MVDLDMAGEASQTDERTMIELDFYICCAVCSAADAFDVLTACLHCICRRCVDTIKENDKYCCPVCKEYSKLLISNSIFCKTESIQKSPNCNWCNDNGEQTTSIGNCKECDVWLCGECLKGHNRMPPLRSHSITMLPKADNQDSLRCGIHPHETLECFCEACGILTCRDCQLSIHRDHGSHRWVGEKATLLASPLQEAVHRLEKCQGKLTDSCQFVVSACSNTKDDSFLASVDKTRSAIEARASSLILRISSRADALLKELTSKCTTSVSQLLATEALMKELQDRITYTLSFANRLMKNKDTDPGSLVQLFEAVQNRISLLHSRAERLLMDAPPSADASEPINEQNQIDRSGWRKATLGWRSVLGTRALFVAHWDPDELTRHSGTIAWLPVPQINGCLVNNSVSDIVKMPSHGDPRDTWGAKPCPLATVLTESQEMPCIDSSEFLDALAVIDGRPNNWSSNTDQAVSGGVGCAICFGAGLLAHCGKCRRAYHLDCHLPRLSTISLFPCWVCGLCEDQDAAVTAQAEQSGGTGLSRVDFLAGCRILLGLLVHPEAVHFTASVCPACSVPLLSTGRSVPHCPAGHLYHRLADLRLDLEEAAVVEDITSGDQPNDDLEAQDQPAFDRSPSANRARLTRLDDWLRELDKFWLDASDESNHIRGATAGCLRAARRLRAHLTFLIRTHRPLSHTTFQTLCDESAMESPQIGCVVSREKNSINIGPERTALKTGGD